MSYKMVCSLYILSYACQLKKYALHKKIFPPLTLYNNAIKLCAQVYATVRSHEIMSQCSCQMVLTDATVHMKQFIFMTTG